MPQRSFQIRLCSSCGLRYPLVEGHNFGVRCPVCLGTTQVIGTYPLVAGDKAREKELVPGRSGKRGELSALLDNIRSAWNVGSIFRTADGFGLSHLYLCGITPTPEVEAVRKTSLGAEETVGWTYHKNAVIAAQEMKARGCLIWALEESEGAVPISRLAETTNENIVLVIGNEVTGVDPGLLELCNRVLYIPMRGNKRSFNVAVAFAIALSQIVL